MALARVVTFDGVSKDRMAEMDREMRDGQPPEGFPDSELIVLHDPEAEKSLVVIIFENEDDYKRGDETLSAMSVAAIGICERFFSAVPSQVVHPVNR